MLGTRGRSRAGAEVLLVFIVGARLVRRPVRHAEHRQRMQARRFAQKPRQNLGQRAIQENAKVRASEFEPIASDAYEQRLAHQTRVRVAQGVEQAVAECQEASRPQQLGAPLPKYFTPFERRQ
ncbi:MAG: hypothetical protein WDO74_09805 [Pseudomonadota bacterium]